MRHVLIATALLLASPACYRDAAPPAPVTSPVAPARAPNPEARFAIVDGMTLRIVHLAPDGTLTVERVATTPAHIDVVVWNGADPAVWLKRDVPWHGGPYTDNLDDEAPEHVNEMGVISAAGYRAFAPLAWPKVPRPTDEVADMMSEASWDTLIGAANGEIWQGHCSWFGGPDGGWCGAFTYARRAPGDGPFGAKEPKLDDGTFSLPDIAHATSIAVTVAKHVEPGEVDDGVEHYDTPHSVHCKPLHGALVEWPNADAAADDPDHTPTTIQNEKVYWIASEPPVYQIDTSFNAAVGQPPDPAYVVFEGCEPSKRYATAFGGPHQLAVVVGSELAVMWRGREIAHAHIAGTLAAFAPAETFSRDNQRTSL